MTWQFDLATDIGGRAEQQDRIEVLSIADRPGEYLVVLADGMGGQQEGALAAQTVVDTARLELEGAADCDPRQFLTELCHKADQAIRDIGRQHNSNPASTCTALYVKGREAYWIHVGDSRLCHFNGETLLLRSSDHTIAELLKDRTGDEDPDLNRADNRLYMCLGGQNELEPEFGASAVGKGDWFLLCSDGFWNHVGSDEVAQARLRTAAEPASASELAAMAQARAGAAGDNLSLALVTPGMAGAKKAWWRLF
jgi:serine/threonine protein phosphatase PrpC